MPATGHWANSPITPIGTVAVVLLALGAAPSSRQATDFGAYGRLLAAHVRPGRVAGIRLNLVDYRAVKLDPDYVRSLEAFARAEPERFASKADRLAFWVNAYNLMAIKAVVDQYPTRSIRDGGSLLRPIWKRTIGTVAGRERTLDDIEHGILRRQFDDPRVHFAIVCASLSCPDLRPEPYEGERLDAQLDDAARAFLSNPTKGLVPGEGGTSARVSSIFKWFAGDFAQAGGVAAFIKAKADPALASKIPGLTDSGLSYLPYDWSVNDTARSQ